jgi:Tat protein secretion system quality control protein TatD with DNase activity
MKTLRAVARIKQISETEVARVTTENAERFFSLSHP